MASERDRFVQAITAQSDNDPELQVVIEQGQELKHKYSLTVEQNRSKEQLRAMDLGWFGRFVGGESSASIFAASIVVFVGLTAFLGCLLAAAWSADKEFWSKQVERSIALTLTSLSYILGRGTAKNSGKP